MTKRVAAIGLAWLGLISTAAAHPGHGRADGDWSALHYLGEPEHLLFAIPFLVLLALVGTRRLRSRRRDRA
jgi:hypothetical protein